MTDKTTPASPAADTTEEASASVTELLAALNENAAAFHDSQGKLLALATGAATKAGEEFARLSLRPDAGEFEEIKARAEQLQLDLSTAQLQLKEVSKEMKTAADGLRESHEVRNRLERNLAEAQATIDGLREAAAADQALIQSMRARTDTLAATFRAARDALSLPDLAELPEAAAAAETARPAGPAPEAADFGLTEPAPEVSEFADPAPVADFPDPAPSDDEDDPFRPVRSIGTFRPASLPDAGFNPPAPEEEEPVRNAATPEAAQEDAGAPDEADAATASVAQADQAAGTEAAGLSGFELPELELPEPEAAQAVSGGLELPELELSDLELPALEAEPAKPGLDLPGLDDLELPEGDKPAAADFGLLELPDLEPEPAR